MLKRLILATIIVSTLVGGCAAAAQQQARQSPPGPGQTRVSDEIERKINTLSDQIGARATSDEQRVTQFEARFDSIEREFRALTEKTSAFWSSPLVVAVVGAALGAVFGVASSWFVSIFLAGKREQKKRAIELLNQFMASEFYTKARLITQEYLLPNGGSFSKSLNGDGSLMDFEQLDKTLGNAPNTQADKDARFYIRAIPSYFWLVQQAMDAGFIDPSENCFDRHYAWYWTFVIEHRIKDRRDDRILRKMPFGDQEQIEKAKRELEEWRKRFPPEWERYPERAAAPK